MSTPARYDLVIYRGDTDAWTFTFWQDAAATIPVDLTGFTATASIRQKADAPRVLADLAAAITLPNIIRVDLDAVTSADLGAACRAGAWDLQVASSGGVVRTLVAGGVDVTADVTRAEVVAP